jgi:hypothetical protein
VPTPVPAPPVEDAGNGGSDNGDEKGKKGKGKKD